MDGDRDGGVPAGGPDDKAPLRFRDYEHVLRMAGLFAGAIVLFLAWRAWAVPPDFGKYGHFRAGAIADAAARTPNYAGRATCIECHGDIEQARQGGKHAQIGCEACHGPLGSHARAETDVAPIRPNARAVCLQCHTAGVGKPKTFPQIVVQEHSSAGPCTECHQAHKPGLS
jgi:predicted CXXCH cytochrome family protein